MKRKTQPKTLPSRTTLRAVKMEMVAMRENLPRLRRSIATEAQMDLLTVKAHSH